MNEDTSFRTKYEAAAARNRSLLCVGLDPDPALIPEDVSSLDFLRAIVEATADLVCCFKPNAAFYEAEGEAGLGTLHALVESIPEEVPVLLDAKRGDIGNTATFYARAIFDEMHADAVTLNPYLGADALEPFFAYEDRHSFVLCRTSNASARDLQDLVVGEGGLRLYEHVALLANRWNTRGNVGLVVGATYPEEAARVRALSPELLLLLPGVGAQAGELEAVVRGAVDAHRGGILVNASRSVLYAGRDAGAGDLAGYASAARAAAAALRDAINAARDAG